jgi:hypothetical protein
VFSCPAADYVPRSPRAALPVDRAGPQERLGDGHVLGEALATQDLPANGGPYKLDVAIKYRRDPQCYAWNDESRFKTHDLRDVGLGEYPVRLRFTLNARALQPQQRTG